MLIEELTMSDNVVAFRKQPKGFATKAIHVGQHPEKWNDMAVVPPIVMSTTYKQFGPAQFKKYEYSRSGNPTRDVLEECLASLEMAKYSLTFSSGLGATTTITQLLKTGDHLLAGDDMYGGTNRLFSKVTSNAGIEINFIDFTNLDNFKKSLKSNTKLIWLETPTNPTLKVIDIEGIATSAHAYSKDIIVVVDNTFLSSYLQRPLEFGADIVIHSLTKYMNGHSDVIMGAIMLNNDELYSRLKFLQNASGIVPSPFDCFQVNRSLKTLAIRMEKHSESGLLIANFLEKHPYVRKVLHPGLPSHPQHQLALRQCYGHSGIMSFYIKGGLTESTKFLKHLNIFTLAESLGGFESLAELPSVMTHSSVPKEQRDNLGIDDSLVRLSIGLEDVEDLIEDIDLALKASQI